MSIQRAAFSRAIAPDVAQDALARDDAPFGGDEGSQEFKFSGGKIQRLASPRCSQPMEVDLESAEPVARSAALGVVSDTPELHPYTGQQLAHLEGLGHVIIAPQFEPADAIGLIRTSGQEDDRNLAAVFSYFAADVESA